MMESLMLIVPSSGSREAVVIVMFAVPKLVTRSFILMFAPVRAFSKVLVRGLNVIAVVRALEIVIFVGSSNSVPICPCGALTSTLPVNCKLFLPEISTKPPFPPTSPPLAKA